MADESTRADPTTPGQTRQVPTGPTPAGSLSQQQAEQLARHLIDTDPQAVAHMVGAPTRGPTPAGAQATFDPRVLLSKLPQIVAFIQAVWSAGVQTGLIPDRTASA